MRAPAIFVALVVWAACATVITAHAQPTPRAIGEAPFEVVMSPDAIAHDGRTIAAVDAGVVAHGDQWGGTVSVQSLVGPILSFHLFESGYLEGGWIQNESWDSVDLRSGAAIALDQMIEPGTPITDVRPHEDLREETGGVRELAEARTLETIDAILARYEIERSGFAVVSYDDALDLATFRVFARAPRLHGEHQPVSLDVVAHAAAWLRPSLLAAREARGHLLERGELRAD